ncbi:MAG: carboxymuconolactone decarboxylase family protein [Chitinophagaceae bacterium]
MNTRINMQQVQPEAYKAMIGLEKYLHGTALTPAQLDLIKIRASQVNGCAYCINMHTRDARKNGETEQRIYLLAAWRGADLFTAEEKAILALTEQVTLISRPVTEDAYENAAPMFTETYLAQIIMAIVAINGWNRIATSTRMQPD